MITTLLVASAATALAFATGAAVVDGPADTFAEERLAVQPADGPNGKYAYLNDDEEIEIDISATNPNLPADFEGLNPDSTGMLSNVFTITYVDDEAARVWIERDDGDDERVAFMSDGETIEGESNSVILRSNESVSIGLDIDASDTSANAEIGPDEFSIHAESVSSGAGSEPATLDTDSTEPSEDDENEENENSSAPGGDDNDTSKPSADDDSEPPESPGNNSDNGTGNGSENDSQPVSDLLEEPGAISLVSVGGLLVLVLLVLISSMLARRVSR